MLATLALGACTPRSPIEGNPANGELLLRQYGCGDCHRITGVAGLQREVGPPLDGVARRLYIAGRLPNSPQQLIGFILDPQQYVPGTTMPTLGLSAAQAHDIAAWLWTQPP